MKFENFEVYEVSPKIFYFKFKDSWKLAITMFRYQEKYESEINKVRNENISFVKLLEIYSKKYGDGNFTYCTDYAGFNFPSEIVQNVLENQYHDFHEYDNEFIKAYSHCKKINGDNNFYIIGATNKYYMLHEIAHGLFYTNEQYKKDMLKLIDSLDKDTLKSFFKVLKFERYHKSVFKDEIQAYLSTGLLTSMYGIVSPLDERKFRKLFRSYYNCNLKI